VVNICYDCGKWKLGKEMGSWDKRGKEIALSRNDTLDPPMLLFFSQNRYKCMSRFSRVVSTYH